eukprot:CAMPEP_0194210506 /NCGR_PEP_ID=MMETSP0156-20130528/8621_1 /TAXON_ID=33649 /ORGANISM="Thalassionema nitzschioides, Strain L26-B" /LENGTH=86 /DNA_ID=CAMNT_0038937861 /DNA_START=53 /DNA_END=310 /DNA_ORIENTATION=+
MKLVLVLLFLTQWLTSTQAFVAVNNANSLMSATSTNPLRTSTMDDVDTVDAATDEKPVDGMSTTDRERILFHNFHYRLELAMRKKW